MVFVNPNASSTSRHTESKCAKKVKALADKLSALREENRTLAAEIRRLEVAKYNDPLTKVGNRLKFQEMFTEFENISKRSGSGFGLAIVDLDNLKQKNDNEGHRGGDKAIIAVADALVAATRSEDVVCRIGGDEFGVLLLNMDGSQKHTLILRILRNIKAKDIRASIGISFYPSDSTSQSRLFEIADKRMYLMKKQHRSATS